MPTTNLAASNFLVPNGTFAFEWLAFMILLWAVWRWVLPPLQRAMEGRQEAIRSQFAEAEAARERMVTAEQEYQQGLAQMRAETARLREEAAAEKAAIIAEARTEAQQQADELLRRAEERIRVEQQQALRALREDVGRLAVDLAERIVRSSLADDERQRHLIDEFIAQIGAEPGEGRPVAASGAQPGSASE